MRASPGLGIARVERNDARIAAAIEAVLVDRGSSALTLRNVALAAGETTTHASAEALLEQLDADQA